MREIDCNCGIPSPTAGGSPRVSGGLWDPFTHGGGITPRVQRSVGSLHPRRGDHPACPAVCGIPSPTAGGSPRVSGGLWDPFTHCGEITLRVRRSVGSLHPRRGDHPACPAVCGIPSSTGNHYECQFSGQDN